MLLQFFHLSCISFASFFTDLPLSSHFPFRAEFPGKPPSHFSPLMATFRPGDGVVCSSQTGTMMWRHCWQFALITTAVNRVKIGVYILVVLFIMLNIILVNLNKHNICYSNNIKIIIINHLRLPVDVFGNYRMVFTFVADLSLLRIQKVEQVKPFFRAIFNFKRIDQLKCFKLRLMISVGFEPQSPSKNMTR